MGFRNATTVVRIQHFAFLGPHGWDLYFGLTLVPARDKKFSMPVKAIPRVSLARNGVHSYLVPCNKITVQYCNWGGSSQGVRDILTNGKLNSFAKENASIFIEIVKKSGHPKLIFNYSNSQLGTNEVDVKNLKFPEVLKKLNEYSQRSGNELFKYNHKVMSNNESVRGIWSPLHEKKGFRHRI